MITWRHWLLCGLLAIALHLAALTGLRAESEDGARDLGEQGIEIDLGLLGHSGEVAAPPAPTPVEVAPSAPPWPATSPEPPPTAPERARPDPELRSKPVARPTEAAVPASAAPQPAAPEPTATTADSVVPAASTETIVASTVPAAVSASPAAATTGVASAATNGGHPGATVTYQTMLAAHLSRYKRYPPLARRRGEEGVATLRFTLDRFGRVTVATILASSGFERLDQSVLQMLERAQPLPAFPDDLTLETMTVNLPVSFRLHE